MSAVSGHLSCIRRPNSILSWVDICVEYRTIRNCFGIVEGPLAYNLGQSVFGDPLPVPGDFGRNDFARELDDATLPPPGLQIKGEKHNLLLLDVVVEERPFFT